MTHPSTTQTRELVVPGRVERQAKRQKRGRRISLVVLIGLALTVGVAGRALAWTASASATNDCDGTTGTVNYGDEPGTHTASFTFAGETKTQTVNAEGGGTITFHFASHDGGPWSYEGTWSESSEVETASGTLSAVTDCEEEQTPPPPTTIKQPEKPVFHGTATNKKRTESNPDDSITPKKEKKKAPVAKKQPGLLPFTGPEDGDSQVHPDRMMFLFFLGLLGIGLVTTGRILLIKARLHRSNR